MSRLWTLLVNRIGEHAAITVPILNIAKTRRQRPLKDYAKTTKNATTPAKSRSPKKSNFKSKVGMPP
jgi:hypothetical protein